MSRNISKILNTIEKISVVGFFMKAVGCDVIDLIVFVPNADAWTPPVIMFSTATDLSLIIIWTIVRCLMTSDRYFRMIAVIVEIRIRSSLILE